MSSQSNTDGGGSSVRGGSAVNMDQDYQDYEVPEMPDYPDMEPEIGAKQRKRSRKSAKLDACTQISKEECRKWVNNMPHLSCNLDRDNRKLMSMH